MNEYIFGNKVVKGQDLEKEKAENFLCHFKNSPINFKEDGLEKTAEEIKVLNDFNDFLGEEFEEMNLPFKDVPQDRIIFLNSESFDKLGEKEFKTALYDNYNNVIVANHGYEEWESKRLFWYKAILHEMIHFVSFQKNLLIKKEDNRTQINNLRVGYRGRGKEVKNDIFKGFNEGMTDLIVMDILKKHKEELALDFNISKEEEEEFISTKKQFYEYAFFINDLIKRIAEKTDKDEGEVWKKMKEGCFTGEMMHLREIERVLGKDSLKILSRLGYSDEENKKVYDFFKLDRD